ncbi:MAG: hypothetical protein AAB263_17545 [Planctomycetota bacterium]
MGFFLRLLLISAFLSSLATAGDASGDVMRLVRGPWQWRTPDGVPHCACVVSGVVVIPPIMPVDDRPVLITSTISELPHEPLLRVIQIHFPVGTLGEVVWSVGHETRKVHLTPAPVRNGPVRIAITSARAWPDQASIKTLSKYLGGPPQFVLALGDNIASRLGTGGWESDVPVMVVSPTNPALTACLGGADAAWRSGLDVGVLGLVASADRSRADLALARNLSPWLVYLDVPGGWDPANGRLDPGSPAVLGTLIAACQRLAVPLVLGAGTSGLISDPLILAPGGAVQPAPGGVRYVLAAPAGDDWLATLPNEIALPLEQPDPPLKSTDPPLKPMISGLVADAQRLECLFVRSDDEQPIRLRWDHGDEPGPAAGRGDVAALVKKLLATESLTTPAAQSDLEYLLWLPRATLLHGDVPPELTVRMRDEGGPFGRAVARRLAVMKNDDPSAKLTGEPDSLVTRDILLWKLTHVRGRDAFSWREAAAATSDIAALSAILSEATRETGGDLLPALVRRVELQAEGTIPLDTEPLLQHRLFTAVFDNVHLSPTPLRPLAVKLRDIVSPLGRGPIDRFIKRHGEQRPVP